MAEIEFSIMVSDESQPLYDLRKYLDIFEGQTHHKVHLTPIEWGNGWAEIIKFGLYGQGPDVSEIGTTWLGSIAAMNALLPFKDSDINQLGGADDFVLACWKTCELEEDIHTWAIPWQADTRLLYYNTSLLAKAGVHDPQADFTDHTSLEKILAKLHASGLERAITLVAQHNINVIYEATSWVWSQGGHFVSPDGSRVLLDQPEALAGLNQYFGLRKYMGQVDLEALNPWQPFIDGQAAVAISGPLTMAQQRQHNPETVKNWAVTLTSGVPFVGGTNLLTWKHTRHPEAALELIDYLTRLPARFPYVSHNGLLPARLSVLQELQSGGHDPFITTCARSLQTGRSLTNRRVWGYLEDKLVRLFPQIWREVLENPSVDPEAVIRKHIEFLVRRTNRALAD